MFLTACLIACVAVFLSYLLFANSYKYWSRRQVPFAKPFAIFGNLFDVISKRKHFNNYLISLYNQYETPYFGIFLLNQPALVVKSPEMIKSILITNFDKFTNRPGAVDEKSDPIMFYAMFSAKDGVWKNLRTKISPVFTSGKLKQMFPLMRKCGEDLENYLVKKDGENVDVRLVCKKIAVDIISSCAFGMDSNCLQDDKPSEILTMATKLLDPTDFRRGFAVFSFFFMPSVFKFLKLTFADKTASDFLVNVFTNVYNKRKNMKIERHDLIDHLYHLKTLEATKDELKFDDLKMASQAVSFFSAGNDTTSTAATFALYELALQPEIQDRLRKEIKKYDNITYENIQEMKYLDMVTLETLRKYPISFLSRTSSSFTFEETNLTIDNGVDVLIPVVALHMDEKYFPNPQTFNPERFNEENKKNIKPFTYFPFGEGPRGCIGQRFGVLALKTILIYALRSLSFHICEESLVPMEYDKNSPFFLLPKGNKLYLNVVKI